MRAKVEKCTRCRRRMRAMDGWNVTMRGGIPVELLCPTCQTPEENAEAVINEATLVYGRTPNGRAIARPKTSEDSL
ncbi:hypothetical protein RQN9TF_17980 [Rhodococcus qingshengii]|uniref:hypothetical protein n=1 Tax=Rhodococcus TaxID=1827 RepID=UPI000F61F653|nr:MULTISPECIES: hypothetical protein [Rhodococcus]AZI62765.1 hypothetical protein EHW12_17530 [Rhodococcus sp. NJ-530]BDQ21106.1 hypothetical protein RQN9TF_17980 [Rhodococcus qingshengii]